MPMPMFPLGSVLFPTMVLPLHVFEPRYRELTRVCLEGDREFGVVLIERGSEVGGDDVRSSYGTVAQIVEAEEMPDGRWALACVGTRRIRVEAWLDDDPYPRADVEPWPDEPDAVESDELVDLRTSVEARVRTVAALRGELGDGVGPVPVGLADDPLLASYQLAAIAPIGLLDRHRLLGASSATARLSDLAAVLDDEEAVARQRLELGD